MIDIILKDIETPGNLGAVARVMKNFGFENLVLLNPKCRKDNGEAMQRAVHARDVLKKAKAVKKIPEYDYLIATTAIIGTDYNINRSPLTPDQLKKILSQVPTKTKVGILFGPEGPGLSNEEIKRCNFTVAIPTSKEYPTLNLSHSVGIICYVLSSLLKKKNITEHINFPTNKDKEILLEKIYQKLDNMKFSTDEKRETQKLVWKKLIGKSFLTKREAMALHGFFNKLR